MQKNSNTPPKVTDKILDFDENERLVNSARIENPEAFILLMSACREGLLEGRVNDVIDTVFMAGMNAYRESGSMMRAYVLHLEGTKEQLAQMTRGTKRDKNEQEPKAHKSAKKTAPPVQTDERVMRLTTEQGEKLVSRILKYEDDDNAAALVALINGIGMEADGSHAEAVAIFATLRAYTFTRDCSKHCDEFVKRAFRELEVKDESSNQ